MSHARVEEVSDSDDASDPSEADISDFADADILRQITPASTSAPPPAAAPAPVFKPAQAAPKYAHYACLYPVYFDATRTRSQGRRVSSSLAVRNPLAREMATACSHLRLPTVLEPEKIHPKDWANPGRVRVDLSGSQIKNKHYLYILVAGHLKAHPTTEDSPGLRMRIGGVLQPPEGKAYPRPAVPRGWKMGDLLPVLSAGMTGGGVSENLFKDMMREMAGEPEENKDKEKKKKKKTKS